LSWVKCAVAFAPEAAAVASTWWSVVLSVVAVALQVVLVWW
jgi:hypothetical protein